MAEQAPLKIVFLDRGTLGVPLREPSFPHSYTEYDATSVDQIVERLADADIAIINKVQVRAASLEKLPKLKLIAVAATGTDTSTRSIAKSTRSRSSISATMR